MRISEVSIGIIRRGQTQHQSLNFHLSIFWLFRKLSLPQIAATSRHATLETMFRQGKKGLRVDSGPVSDTLSPGFYN